MQPMGLQRVGYNLATKQQQNVKKHVYLCSVDSDLSKYDFRTKRLYALSFKSHTFITSQVNKK